MIAAGRGFLMQNCLILAVLLGISFASGGAASFSFFERTPVQSPTIMVVHTPSEATLRVMVGN